MRLIELKSSSIIMHVYCLTDCFMIIILDKDAKSLVDNFLE